MRTHAHTRRVNAIKIDAWASLCSLHNVSFWESIHPLIKSPFWIRAAGDPAAQMETDKQILFFIFYYFVINAFSSTFHPFTGLFLLCYPEYFGNQTQQIH